MYVPITFMLGPANWGFSQMTLVGKKLRSKNTPQTFDYTKSDGTKVKVTLDTNIGFLDDPSFVRRLQVKGQNLRNVPQDYGASKYDELLEKNPGVGWKHSVWKKPS